MTDYSILFLYLTGAVFVGTGIALFLFLWKYDAGQNRDQVKYVHGSHTLEIVWSILPAATLLFIAIYQMDTWAHAKLDRPDDAARARMAWWGHRMTAPWWKWWPASSNGGFATRGPTTCCLTPDDLFTVNDLRLPVDEEVVISLKSDDVLHSFFLAEYAGQAGRGARA